MIIIPREKPVIEKLNSYYIDMEKLIGHYQAELDAGGIHLRSTSAEGLIFFDKDTITNVFFQEKNELMDGIPARDELIRNLKVHNFTMSVYRIEPEKFLYWANVNKAEDHYRGLGTTTGETLEGVIRRMNAEHLTGYIEVAFTGAPDYGLILFYDGHIIGITNSLDQDESADTRQNLQRLMQQSKTSGASFNVKRVGLSLYRSDGDSAAQGLGAPGEVVALLQTLLSTLESLVATEKSIKTDFDTLLKKKFFEKADSYEFLDPYAAEVQYAGGSLEFTGDTPLPQMVKGVSESVLELAEDLGLRPLLAQKFAPFKKQYQDELTRFGIKI